MSERAEKRAHAAEENGDDVVAAKQSKGENGKAEDKNESVKGKIHIPNYTPLRSTHCANDVWFPARKCTLLRCIII